MRSQPPRVARCQPRPFRPFLPRVDCAAAAAAGGGGGARAARGVRAVLPRWARWECARLEGALPLLREQVYQQYASVPGSISPRQMVDACKRLAGEDLIRSLAPTMQQMAIRQVAAQRAAQAAQAQGGVPVAAPVAVVGLVKALSMIQDTISLRATVVPVEAVQGGTCLAQEGEAMALEPLGKGTPVDLESQMVITDRFAAVVAAELALREVHQILLQELVEQEASVAISPSRELVVLWRWRWWHVLKLWRTRWSRRWKCWKYVLCTKLLCYRKYRRWRRRV